MAAHAKVSRKTEGVYVCPNCGSPTLKSASMRVGATSALTGYGTPPIVYCEDCKYEGPPIMIDKDKVGEFIKELKKNTKEIRTKQSLEKTREDTTFKTPVKPLFSEGYKSIMRKIILLDLVGGFILILVAMIMVSFGVSYYIGSYVLILGSLCILIPLIILGIYAVVYKPWLGKNTS